MKFSKGERRAVRKLRRQFKMTGDEVYDPGKSGKCNDYGKTIYVKRPDENEWRD